MFTFLNKCTTISTINSIPRTANIYYSYHKLFYFQAKQELCSLEFFSLVPFVDSRRVFSLYFIAILFSVCFNCILFRKVYRFELLKSKDPWTKFVKHEFYDFLTVDGRPGARGQSMIGADEPTTNQLTFNQKDNYKITAYCYKWVICIHRKKMPNEPCPTEFMFEILI